VSSAARSVTIVCLMNAQRHGAYAVAGVEVGSRSWVRLVGSGPYGGVTTAEQTLEDGSGPSIFDIVEVYVADAVRDHGRADTWRIDTGAWTRNGQIEGSARRALLESLATEEPVFGTNEESLSVWSLVGLGPAPSIAIVRPRRLVWIKGVASLRPKLVAAFEHADARQQLPVVDRAWLARFADAEMGQIAASDDQDTFLVITSEPLGEEYWKLVSAVLELPREDSAPPAADA
jgi:putative nucleic acid modification protein with dual OB domain